MSDIHVWIKELTQVHTHREPYTRYRGQTTVKLAHVTKVPALIHQLLGSAPQGSGDQSGAKPHSRPAARIEALDTLIQIDDEAARWIRRLGENDPGDSIDPQTAQAIAGSGTIRCLLMLHGIHASAVACGQAPKRNDAGRVTCCTRHKIEADTRRWWHQARIITGWDTPAYRPFNTCPICDHRGGLRINLDINSALCIECRTTWTPEDIGLLAEHIRAENQDEQDPNEQQAEGA